MSLKYVTYDCRGDYLAEDRNGSNDRNDGVGPVRRVPLLRLAQKQFEHNGYNALALRDTYQPSGIGLALRFLPLSRPVESTSQL